MAAFVETNRRLDFKEAEEHLYQIWYGYENTRVKTRHDTVAREGMITSLERSLTEDAHRYLSENVRVMVDGEEVVVDRRREIRWRAVRDVRKQWEEQKRLKAEEERRKRPSLGERRAIRRMKATSKDKRIDRDSIH